MPLVFNDNFTNYHDGILAGQIASNGSVWLHGNDQGDTPPNGMRIIGGKLSAWGYGDAYLPFAADWTRPWQLVAKYVYVPNAGNSGELFLTIGTGNDFGNFLAVGITAVNTAGSIVANVGVDTVDGTVNRTPVTMISGQEYTIRATYNGTTLVVDFDGVICYSHATDMSPYGAFFGVISGMDQVPVNFINSVHIEANMSTPTFAIAAAPVQIEAATNAQRPLCLIGAIMYSWDNTSNGNLQTINIATGTPTDIVGVGNVIAPALGAHPLGLIIGDATASYYIGDLTGIQIAQYIWPWPEAHAFQPAGALYNSDLGKIVTLTEQDGTASSVDRIEVYSTPASTNNSDPITPDATYAPVAGEFGVLGNIARFGTGYVLTDTTANRKLVFLNSDFSLDAAVQVSTSAIADHTLWGLTVGSNSQIYLTDYDVTGTNAIKLYRLWRTDGNLNLTTGDTILGGTVSGNITFTGSSTITSSSAALIISGATISVVGTLTILKGTNTITDTATIYRVYPGGKLFFSGWSPTAGISSGSPTATILPI